ncbi:MAG: GNAT family N-acetyltransferase [Paraclostridium sp.]
MVKLKELPIEDTDKSPRRLKYSILKDDNNVGKIDIILFSDFFKQHDYDPTIIHEVSIVVKDDFKNQGIGKAAMRCLLDLIKTMPLIYPVWSIVHETNYASIKLHEKLPFIHKKKHREYLMGNTEIFICYRLK